MAEGGGIGQLCTSVATTSLGAAASLNGEQYESVEIQYLGGGQFSVLSCAGHLVVQ